MSTVHSLDAFLAFASRFASMSKAQLLQDLWVLWEQGFESGRVFIDIGAADGKFLSNTFLLEQMGWTGFLVEANAKFHPDLRASRALPAIHKCLWSQSGQQMTLRSVESFLELSRLEAVQDPDNHEEEGRRAQFEVQQVESITLLDLLNGQNAPPVIDYLSIDIEGSEYEAIRAFDFSKFRFRCLTVEHNYTAAREPIHALLTENGYRRKWPEISAWDDWYVLADPVELAGFYEAKSPAADSYRRLQQIRLERGEAEAALSLSWDMFRLWPQDAAHAYSLATALMSKGLLAETRDVIATLLAHSPDFAEAYNLDSHVLAQLGNLEAAVAASARAVELNPEQSMWRVRHGILLFRLRRYEESVEVLRAAVERHPEDTTALLALARACHALGRSEEAVALADRAVAAAPSDPAGHAGAACGPASGTSGVGANSGARQPHRCRGLSPAL